MSTQVKDDNSADSSRKISIRFFNDHEVRAFWDEENSKWWFSATDIIGAVNNEADYTKAGNYWRWLKRKLKLQGVQFVSSTHKLKITAADGKKYSSPEQIERMPEETFEQIADKYVEMNVAHPFMEGNGRATRIWLDLMLKHSLNRCIECSRIDKNDYLKAMSEFVADAAPIKKLLFEALTDKIDDREMFMKGIDYSYYYEEEDGSR